MRAQNLWISSFDRLPSFVELCEQWKHYFLIRLSLIYTSSFTVLKHSKHLQNLDSALELLQNGHS